MEPNIERTDETQKENNPDERHALAPSDILLACLTDCEASAEDLQALAQTCSGPYALAMIKPSAQRGYVNLQDIVDFAKSMHIRSTETQLENALVMLLANEDARRLAQAIEEKGVANKAAVAVSLPFASLDAIHMQYKLLTYCFNSNDSTGIIEAKRDAFSFLTSLITSAIDVKSLFHPAIAKLTRYDQMNQSNLLETLRVYLENDRNAQHCANLLYLHRNSLQYRVRRIQDIAGIDLDNAEERAYLRLSFMLCDK